MAELKLEGFQEMIDALDNLGKEGENIFKKALNDGAKIVQVAIQRHAPVYQGPPKKGVIPGLLKANILIGKVRKQKDGAYTQVVGPTKGDITKVYYGKFSEYGTSREPARPWIRPAFDESQDTAYSTIETIVMNGVEQAYKK